MLYKKAFCDAVSLNQDFGSQGQLGLVKTASGRVMIEPNSEKARLIEAEIQKHPTALFFRAKAIKADEANSNGDYFSKDELLSSYKSFEGVPFFTNHDNQNIENARGKIVFAEWDEAEQSIYTIAFVDREAFPHICRSIEEEYVTGVSMGCSVEYSVCNICGNKAEKTDDYCTHIRNRKGRNFSGKAKDVKTGEMKTFSNQLVFEYNYGIKFIELSAVVDPACTSCHIEGIIPNDDYISKVANMQNALYMIRTSAIQKNAGQEEVNELNEVLQTLEEIAVNLIQNRQQVEVEFASDLVAILSDLQKFVDELVGAGYGNVQDVPGTMDMPEEGLPMEGEMPMEGEVPPAVQPGAAPMPVAAETAMPGTVSGAPSNPAVSRPQRPQMPITGTPAMAFDVTKLTKLADINKVASSLMNKIEKLGGNNMAKRRTRSAKKEQQQAVREVLSNSWQEKQNFFEYIKQVPSLQDDNGKISVKKSDDNFIIVAESKTVDIENIQTKVWTYEDLTEEERRMVKESPQEAAICLLNTFANNLNQQKEGVANMTSERKEAGANSVNKAPEVTQEVQLQQQRDLYHPRTDVEENVTTEKQLEQDTGLHQRTGEPDVITEVQLEAKTNKLHPREDAEVQVTEEVQLQNDKAGVSPRKGEDLDVVTQKQLDPNRVDAEPEVVTEVQLNNISAPWERSANRDASLFRSAGEHVDAVVDALANSVIGTGATSDEVSEVAGSLVESTKARYELENAILEEGSEEAVDSAKRLAFWADKNIKVASVGSKEISSSIVMELRKVASDETINPEIIIDALDVITEGDEGISTINDKVTEKLESAKEASTSRVSRKAELRAALKNSSGKEARDEERKQIEASLEEKDEEAKTQPDHMIETSIEEVGCDKREAGFKSAIVSFARGALASQNMRLASVTNVTINGDTIQIAVQTDEEDEASSVEIPIGEMTGPEEMDMVPEGDMAGEGLESALPEQGLEAPLASSGRKMQRTAQSPMGGGVPGTPGENAGGPGAPDQVPGGMPEEAPVQALTTEEDVEISDEIPTTGKQQMPYAICPECGSSNVDIQKEAHGNIEGSCNKCGAEYEALVKKAIEFTITKPSLSIGEEGLESPETPEVPALPVAAQTKLDKNSIMRIASNKEKHGHVCPACGMSQCKVAAAEAGHEEFTCPACGTDVEKDVIVNVNNPEDSFLRVKWDLTPDTENCEGCQASVAKFASMLKIEKMVTAAAGDVADFPMTNCMERIARTYGGNTVATFGPCKGKALADCVCNQLKSFGLRTVRHMEKLAAVYTQADPMEECLEDQAKQGFDIKEATNICNCMKKKFASEDDDPFVQAFAADVDSGREKVLTAQDLKSLSDFIVDDEGSDVVEDYVDEDIGDDLPSIEEEETVTIEISKESAEELADAVEVAVEPEESMEDVGVAEDVEVVEGVPEMGSAVDVEVAASSEAEVVKETSSEEEKQIEAMKSHKLRRVGEEVVKVASIPEKVEDIEGDVRAGVPRAKATMGEEGADNIDVPMAKPSVPRAKATMGHEGTGNIDVPAGLPDVAVDSSYMGQEKSMQSDMPAINNEIKGTVIAEDTKVTKEAKELKEVDSVEGDVEAGVPRAKATMGEEGADNIDVPMAKPSVPRAKATMGKEGPDNIDVASPAPDVPVDSAYMGQEKSMQKDMPAINDEMLKNVQQSNERQHERIAAARMNEAVKVAAKLLATKRITEEAYEDVIEALSNFAIDQISVKAENMYPARKIVQASAATEGAHTVPAIVMESKGPQESTSLVDRLTQQFTIGNKSFDETLTRYNEK